MLQHVLVEYVPSFFACDGLKDVIELAGDNAYCLLVGRSGLDLRKDAMSFTALQHRQQDEHDAVDDSPGQDCTESRDDQFIHVLDGDWLAWIGAV